MIILDKNWKKGAETKEVKRGCTIISKEARQYLRFLKKKFTPKYCLITIQLGGSSEGYIFVFLEHIMKPKNT